MKISELPTEVRQLAREYFNDEDNNLSTAFVWEKTKEGFKYWEEWYERKPSYRDNLISNVILKEEPKNYDDVIAIIETKIATMSSRGFESYYLPIGILKDLIREIKEIK